MDAIKPYYQQQRDEMLTYIPTGVAHTLEIGCGAGSFSAQIKHDLGAETWGVEYQPEAAALAAQKLDHVLTGSVEAILPTLPRHFFDCIIFNDVLEHLVDPYTTLVEVQPLLTLNGVIVASIPNIRHWPEFVDYTWRGNWNYRDDGVLDRTHLRFFTRRSIGNTLNKCGYQAVTIEGINPYHSRGQRLATLLSLGRLADTRFKQYAVVARPAQSAVS